MRLLAVNQFYAPDLSATAQLLTQLGEDLVRAGDQVTVVTGRGGYLGGRAPELATREERHGVAVVRTWTADLGKATIGHRLGDYLSFWVGAVARLVVEARPDVVLCLTTPPMIASGVAAVCRARRIPLVLWVQDVYPELAAAFGLLSPRHPLFVALRAVNRATYGSAARVVALGDDMAERLARSGVAARRLAVVHNWADGQAIVPLPRDGNPFRAEHGLGDRFVAMYSGNLGHGHDVETFIGAAQLLATSHPEVRLLFVGDGARRRQAEELARGLDNVRFLPYQPEERLAESLSAADVHLASLRPELRGLLVPSKLYGVLAAGRPLLFVGPRDCELGRVVEQHELGAVVAPGDASGLAGAIARASQDPQETARRGERARRLLLERFDRGHAVRRWRALLADAASRG